MGVAEVVRIGVPTVVLGMETEASFMVYCCCYFFSFSIFPLDTMYHSWPIRRNHTRSKNQISRRCMTTGRVERRQQVVFFVACSE